jgi:hypothetical protein
MATTKVYVGNLDPRVEERDLDDEVRLVRLSCSSHVGRGELRTVLTSIPEASFADPRSSASLVPSPKSGLPASRLALVSTQSAVGMVSPSHSVT